VPPGHIPATVSQPLGQHVHRVKDITFCRQRCNSISESLILTKLMPTICFNFWCLNPTRALELSTAYANLFQIQIYYYRYTEHCAIMKFNAEKPIRRKYSTAFLYWRKRSKLLHFICFYSYKVYAALKTEKYVCPKRRHLPTSLHRAETQNNIIIITEKITSYAMSNSEKDSDSFFKTSVYS
jgi:hypothetical protein